MSEAAAPNLENGMPVVTFGRVRRPFRMWHQRMASSCLKSVVHETLDVEAFSEA